MSWVTFVILIFSEKTIWLKKHIAWLCWLMLWWYVDTCYDDMTCKWLCMVECMFIISNTSVGIRTMVWTNAWWKPCNALSFWLFFMHVKINCSIYNHQTRCYFEYFLKVRNVPHPEVVELQRYMKSSMGSGNGWRNEGRLEGTCKQWKVKEVIGFPNLC